jgi:hypothetical protein
MKKYLSKTDHASPLKADQVLAKTEPGHLARRRRIPVQESFHGSK